uniref:G_PROTEIN_RECEP_F1_2 domain-containing protein n=2 Tax=Caenorhabditis tropicalis TaxID=1561998 RepID=A0A1I7SZ10_9PELO
MNILVILRMRREKESFHRICVTKAIANILILTAYIVWAVPCSYMNAYYFPQPFNAFFGAVIGWGPYLMSGPFTQICLAVNRAIAISYPHWFDRNHRIPYTKLTLYGLWTFALLISLPSFIDGCSYLFYPESIAWGTMDTPCSRTLTDLFLTGVITMSIFSFTVNITNILKLLKMSMRMGNSISEDASTARKKRRRAMFVQCIIQDCTHASDCFINNYLYTFYSAQWFQFLCGAVSGLFIILVDGLLMTVLHRKLRNVNRGASRVSTVHSIHVS